MNIRKEPELQACCGSQTARFEDSTPGEHLNAEKKAVNLRNPGAAFRAGVGG